jgi:PEP-CTERM motif
MKSRFIAAAVVLTLSMPCTASAQLFMEDFDVDPTASWTVNDGPTDEYAEFHYDYSNLGIPSAPNSGGSTHGMRLRANLIDGVFGGFSVSPTGESFTGDYRLTFDFWHNFIGGFQQGVGVIGTTPGSTMLSLFGIETSGTTANYPGAADGIWFAATGDTSSSAFRAYSSERNVSYQLPIDETILDGEGNPVDSHATYLANTRSNNPATGGGNEVYYQNAFPSVNVPAGQTSLYPDFQFGSTQPGTVGFAWHEVEIEKIGNTVTWTMDDTLLMTLETEDFVTPTAGTNILFGHSDINAAVSTEDAYLETAFTLIDNILVEAIDEGLIGDYNDDGKVDAADYVLWRKDPASHGGDPQGYDDWAANFGEPSGGGSGLGVDAVPEPGALAISMIGLISLAASWRRRR